MSRELNVMGSQRKLNGWGFFLLILLKAQTAFAGLGPCDTLLVGGAPDQTIESAWEQSIHALKQVRQKVHGRDQAIELLAQAILSKDFVWLSGEPGGAKTYLSRLMFQSVLNSIPEQEKRIFLLQFHKLISEGKITGFPKFSSLLKEGKYEIETASSLVGDKFLFLIADEAEKAPPAALNALLAVLNERQVFLGTRVVNSILSSGVFTSNKTTGEFVQGFLNDRSSGEALLDRMAIKINIANQQTTSEETVAVYDLIHSPSSLNIVLPLPQLESLLEQVTIPEDLMAEIVSIAREFDRYVTEKADRSLTEVRFGTNDSEYFPANQFSSRSYKTLIRSFKSALITSQLMKGVPFAEVRLIPNRLDLSLLSHGSVYLGLSRLELKSHQIADSLNGVKVQSAQGVIAKMAVHYSPYQSEFHLKDWAGQTQFIFAWKENRWTEIYRHQSFTGWIVDPAELESLRPLLDRAVQAQGIDLSQPKFQVDSVIDQLLAKGTLKSRTIAEYKSNKEDLERFAEILNQHLEQQPKPWLVPRPMPLEPIPAKDSVAEQYQAMVQQIKIFKQRFVELDHYLEALLTGISARTHVFVSGPPGGAKTALADVVLKAELESLNDAITDKSQALDRFFLQFHKLLPEGVLIGFPKIEKKLDEGIEEIEFTSSLANPKFPFAILDEVDKAQPQTSAALLSILNEREVFAGNQVIKTALRTAVLTSNKVTSEYLDSYFDDRTTGEALLDRALNKVYVSNKISTEEALTQFLIGLEDANATTAKSRLAISSLDPLVRQVEFESPALKNILAQVHQQFLSSRVQKEEKSRLTHESDSREFAHYYVSAAGSASDRTFNALMEQLKSRFIVNQLMKGVEYKDLRTRIELKDLKLFFEGLSYWAPQSIEHSYTADGDLQFINNSEIIDRLLSTGVVRARDKYQLSMMRDEAEDFVRILNSVTNTFLHSYRQEVAKYRSLFPLALANLEQINLAIRDLARLNLYLELAKVQGETSAVMLALKTDFEKKLSVVKQAVIEQKMMTEAQFFERLKEKTSALQSAPQSTAQQDVVSDQQQAALVKEQVEKIQSQVTDGAQATFHKVSAGQFKSHRLSVPVEITKPYEFMATPMTQIVWKKIAELAEQKFPGKFILDPAPSQFKGDLLPVESVSYVDVTNWISALNELSRSGEPSLEEWIAGHRKNDIYRLPTEAEWVLVLLGHGRQTYMEMVGRDGPGFDAIAWHSGNSAGRTHSVAQKDPIQIGQKKFYDMIGNVGEWVQDYHGDWGMVGVDPQGPQQGFFRVTRGGSWQTPKKTLHEAERGREMPDVRKSELGFRLVRTVPIAPTPARSVRNIR